MAKEHLKSRLGFILISAGCAIGIGNVWKFPYITGQNGGGMFVLIYLFFLAVLGIPVLVMEFSLGRASQKSPSQMYKVLEPKGSKWHLHGYVTVIGCYLLMMFYTTVAGWMLDYFVKMTKGDFVGADTGKVGQIFENMMGNPIEQTVFMAITLVLAVIVCSIGLQKGLEKVTKGIMVALLGIMVILAIN
ncbi:MAG: sodium-dependent transporter, partial [Clostridia bacterium]|nr:sodium-dependent transporter [Clostridia bacterium]